MGNHPNQPTAILHGFQKYQAALPALGSLTVGWRACYSRIVENNVAAGFAFSNHFRIFDVTFASLHSSNATTMRFSSLTRRKLRCWLLQDIFVVSIVQTCLVKIWESHFQTKGIAEIEIKSALGCANRLN